MCTKVKSKESLGLYDSCTTAVIIGDVVRYLPYVRLVLTEISPRSSGEAREEEVYVGSHAFSCPPFTLGTTPATPGGSRTGSPPVLSLSPGCRASTNRTGLDPALNFLPLFLSLCICLSPSPSLLELAQVRLNRCLILTYPKGPWHRAIWSTICFGVPVFLFFFYLLGQLLP